MRRRDAGRVGLEPLSSRMAYLRWYPQMRQNSFKICCRPIVSAFRYLGWMAFKYSHLDVRLMR